MIAFLTHILLRFKLESACKIPSEYHQIKKKKINLWTVFIYLSVTVIDYLTNRPSSTDCQMQ